MAGDVTISIDGQEVRTAADKMVIQAANDAGIYIPYLCYHPGMTPYGACRMCVVEVEGVRGTPASCTLPVREGMVVNTRASSPVEVRDTIMDLLLSEHPHGCLTCHRIDLCGPQDICLRHVDVTDRCVTCPKNERCELKDTTRFHTQGLNSPLTYQYRELQIETQDPFYDRDYNLCIVCARCVRACDELRGDVALTMTERAGQVLVGTVMGDSLLEAGCEFCGACIDVCPVGALTERDYKWERPARVEQSVCSECPVGCQITYEVNRWERVIRAIPELMAPANRGQACFKGKFGFKHVNAAGRLKQPLVRGAEGLAEATWEEATALVAERLAGYAGPEFGLLMSPRATNEELYLAQKFARVAMRSNNVDSPSNVRPGLLDGLRDVLGHAAATGAVWDVKQADCVLVLSANVTEEQNVLAVPIKQAVRAGTQQLIVVDAREVELTRYATVWLRPYPGTDLALLGGMLRVILEEGLADQSFVDAAVDGLAELWDSLAPFGLDAVAAETGVPADRVREAARMLAAAGCASILYGLDGVAPAAQAPTSRAVADLALVTGNLGKPGAGVYPLRPGANDQGAWDMGLEPRYLPGPSSVGDEAARRRATEVWGASPPEEPGLGVEQMLAAARDGRVKALMVLGDHPRYHDGSLGDVAEAFSRLEFLVVSDAFRTDLADHADVVLPARTWLEKRGTYTSLERRVQPLRQVFDLHTATAAPWDETIGAIAERMGRPVALAGAPEAVLDEAARLIPTYGGISYQRLLDEAVETARPSPELPMPTQVMYSERVAHGLQWPCPGPGHPGSALLFADGFAQGRVHLAPLEWMPVDRRREPGLPLLLAHGRVLAQPTHPVEVVRGGRLNRMQRDEQVLLHPADATAASVEDGQRIRVVAGGGRVVAEGLARLGTEAHQGVANVTTLFGELAVDLAGSEHVEPMHHVPRLDVVPIRVERV